MFPFIQASLVSVPETFPSTCQTITLPLCKDLPYTETVLPTILGHKTQEEAHLGMSGLLPLVQTGCSPHLKPFLCSLYLPKCESGKAQSPCKTLCEQVRAGCEPVMNRFAVQWPEILNCETFGTESCGQVSQHHLLEKKNRKCLEEHLYLVLFNCSQP